MNMDNITWYHNLAKPALNPPDWVFAPVWGVLYLLMALSFIILLRTKYENKTTAILLFLSQLGLNLIWSPVFFGWMNPKGALITIVLLIITLSGTVIAFYKHSKPAAILLIPYFIWVCFAAYLNFEIVRLNLYF